MATTTVETATSPALNLTLQNGQKIRYHSDVSIEADEIPVIDVKDIYSDDIQARKAVAEQVREAAHRIRFFYIVNHGIDSIYAENTFGQKRRGFLHNLMRRRWKYVRISSQSTSAIFRWQRSVF
jgi:hypothetical protein